jgi:hypothetical protein
MHLRCAVLHRAAALQCLEASLAAFADDCFGKARLLLVLADQLAAARRMCCWHGPAQQLPLRLCRWLLHC